MSNRCDICERRPGSLFLTVSQPQLLRTSPSDNGRKVRHVAKAHACSVCYEILVEQQEKDGSTVEEISQKEYNDLPQVRDIDESTP